MSQEERCKEQNADVETHEERVKLAAYYRWKENGEQHGRDLDDWYEAEKSCCD